MYFYSNGEYLRLRKDAYGTAFGSSKHLLCIFKIIFIDHPNVASMYIREVFGTHSRSIIIIIIKLSCHIQRALHDELECSLALTHIVPIYTIK